MEGSGDGSLVHFRVYKSSGRDFDSATNRNLFCESAVILNAEEYISIFMIGTTCALISFTIVTKDEQNMHILVNVDLLFARELTMTTICAASAPI